MKKKPEQTRAAKGAREYDFSRGIRGKYASRYATEDLAVAEKRLADGRANPGSAVPLEEMNTRLRTRFAG